MTPVSVAIKILNHWWAFKLHYLITVTSRCRKCAYTLKREIRTKEVRQCDRWIGAFTCGVVTEICPSCRPDGRPLAAEEVIGYTPHEFKTGDRIELTIQAVVAIPPSADNSLPGPLDVSAMWINIDGVHESIVADARGCRLIEGVK